MKVTKEKSTAHHQNEIPTTSTNQPDWEKGGRFAFENHRQDSFAQAKLQSVIINGSYPSVQRMLPESLHIGVTPQQEPGEKEKELSQGMMTKRVHPSLQGQKATSPNKTGLPEDLKAGVESLSGIDMGDVRVHRNSRTPAQLNALAYTQGNDIHIAPGQERHLPHEAWHAVQQKQGRVKPTMNLKGARINDDVKLEKEADRMATKAIKMPFQMKTSSNRNSRRSGPVLQMVHEGNGIKFITVDPIAGVAMKDNSSNRKYGLYTWGMTSCASIIIENSSGELCLAHCPGTDIYKNIEKEREEKTEKNLREKLDTAAKVTLVYGSDYERVYTTHLAYELVEESKFDENDAKTIVAVDWVAVGPDGNVYHPNNVEWKPKKIDDTKKCCIM